jgi:hypothetical protein
MFQCKMQFNVSKGTILLTGATVITSLLASYVGKTYSYVLNSLTLELNTSAQRCRPRLFTGDFNV